MKIEIVSDISESPGKGQKPVFSFRINTQDKVLSYNGILHCATGNCAYHELTALLVAINIAASEHMKAGDTVVAYTDVIHATKGHMGKKFEEELNKVRKRYGINIHTVAIQQSTKFKDVYRQCHLAANIRRNIKFGRFKDMTLEDKHIRFTSSQGGKTLTPMWIK